MAQKTDIDKLAAELLLNHPTTDQPYSSNNKTATNQINEKNRPAEADTDDLRNYFRLKRAGGMALIGRLVIASGAEKTTDPLATGVPLTLIHITSAISMLRIVDSASGFRLDLNRPEFDDLLKDLAVSGGGAKIISDADRTAIKSMSSNLQSRAQEENISQNVRENDTVKARAQEA